MRNLHFLHQFGTLKNLKFLANKKNDSQGGLKAVVWTDTLQSFSMILGLLVVAIVGTIEVGGFGVVIQRAAESGRFEFFKYKISIIFIK